MRDAVLTSGARGQLLSGGVLAAKALLAVVITLLFCAGTIPLARAADPLASGPLASAAPVSEVRLTAEPLLAGNVRPGDWAAVRVHLENDGPAVDGELRIASSEQGASSYGVVVQLATGARQDHVIYGQAGPFGSRFTASLVSDGAVVTSGKTTVHTIDPGALGVYVVAERPDRLIGDIRASIASRQGPLSSVVAIAPEDLPPRAEAWAAVDRLVWQDVPASRLSTEQLDALRTWVALGGELVILGGSTGAASMDGFPDELLPYRPDRVVDVPVSDLADLLGSLPAGATSLPAAAGTLERGTALAESDGLAVAAQLAYGQGQVSVIGIDPATPWLAGSSVATALWTRAMPADTPSADPQAAQDDGMLIDALSYLPSVEVPRMDQLFLLFLLYVVLLGPVNYLVLRRLDRREWAWFTIPALALVFTVGAFLFGTVLRGSNVVVNELGVVRGAAGTDRGVADVHVGVFSPSRTAFDVHIPGGAFISGSGTDQQGREQPLDILLGDPAHVRGFQVGYGDLRGFRAEAAVATPRIDTDLRLVGDRLQGTLTNASGQPLDNVSIAYGGGLQMLAAMAAGEVRTIDVAPEVPSDSTRSLATRLFGGTSATDATDPRTLASRIAIIQSLSGNSRWGGGPQVDPLSGYGPVVLAWRSGGILDVDLGVTADKVGDTLFLLPVRVAGTGPVSLTGGTVQHSVVDVGAAESYDDPSGSYFSRGTMTVAFRPAGLEGALQVNDMTLRLADRHQIAAAYGDDLVALPDADQPDQADPVGTGTPGPDAFGGLPRVQLFDREAGRWIEFEPMATSKTYRVVDPGRYVDASGGFLVRFVNRAANEQNTFVLDVRLDGVLP